MIIDGIQSGAVLQRNPQTNTCDIRLIYKGKNLSCNMGALTKLDNERYSLCEIPTGGPYRLVFSDGEDECVFTDVYVGDLWLLAGQSNMEGAGRLRPQDSPEHCAVDSVRAYYMDDHWGKAIPDLHQLWTSKDPAHVRATELNMGLTPEMAAAKSKEMLKNHVKCVGPGFFFGRKLFEHSSVPQGLLPTAIGGAPIELWYPQNDGTENYYSAACRRIISCGGNIRGIFWYQGEGFGGADEDYVKMFESMRKGFAALCEKDEIPCVQVQLFRSTIPSILRSETSNFDWSRFRSNQLKMEAELPCLATVASNDLDLDDCIHLSANSQEILGIRGANAMAELIEKGKACEPRIESVEILPDSCSSSVLALRIKFKNLCGALGSTGIPSGFSLSDGNSIPDEGGIQRISLAEDSAIIRVEYDLETLRSKKLWYGFGHSFYCNIQDESHRAIPSFGPISLDSAICNINE